MIDAMIKVSLPHLPALVHSVRDIDISMNVTTENLPVPLLDVLRAMNSDILFKTVDFYRYE